jgi:hypothetical protein
MAAQLTGIRGKAEEGVVVGVRRHREHSDEAVYERTVVSFMLFFSASLLLSSCGDAGPECGSLDTRNSVVKIISDDIFEIWGVQ